MASFQNSEEFCYDSFIWAYYKPHITCLRPCGRQNNLPPPKDVYVLIPRTCEFLTLHGNGELRLLIS